jgi:hypothetical protein
MCKPHHAKYPLSLSQFRKTWIFSTDFRNILKISNFTKIRHVAADSFQTWRSFSQFCERAQKLCHRFSSKAFLTREWKIFEVGITVSWSGNCFQRLPSRVFYCKMLLLKSVCCRKLLRETRDVCHCQAESLSVTRQSSDRPFYTSQEITSFIFSVLSIASLVLNVTI